MRGEIFGTAVAQKAIEWSFILTWILYQTGIAPPTPLYRYALKRVRDSIIGTSFNSG